MEILASLDYFVGIVKDIIRDGEEIDVLRKQFRNFIQDNANPQ